MKKSLVALTALTSLSGLVLNLSAADSPAAKPAAPAASTTPVTAPAAKSDDIIRIKPYPLDTCTVSGNKIGSMGAGPVIIYNGQEVKFCCSDCPADFAKTPDKYLKMITDAEAKVAASAPKNQKETAPKPYPLDYSVVSGDKLSTVAKPIVVIYSGQEIKFVKKTELDTFYKDPVDVMKKIADASTKTK